MATFFGSAAGETINGTAEADSISGAGGDDTLNGKAGNDTIDGGAGDDAIDGGTGDDVLIGGTGNDTFTVDSLGDIVTEAAGEGNDSIIASASYGLRSNVSVETMSLSSAAAAGSFLIGNNFAQTLNGNDVANTIDGGRNATGQTGDTLNGGGGDDNIVVNNAADIVDGGTGSDTIFVDAQSLLAAGALVPSWSAVNSSNFEVMTARDQGSNQALNLTGNANAQTIIGNFGANVITSAGGADTLIGLNGNDTYVVQASNADVVIQEASGAEGGADTLSIIGAGSYDLSANSDDAAIESIKVDANFDGTITGNSFAQKIDGSATGDQANAATTGITLVGAGGADTLIGGEGSDVFVVDSADDVIQDRSVTTANGTGTNPASIETNSVEFAGATGGFDLADGVNVGTISVQDAATTGNIYLVGNNFNQTITGNAGNNILDGQGATTTIATGAAAAGLGDRLEGLGGDDIYRTYTTNDVVVENADEGNDTIYTSAASYTVANNVETLSAFDQSSTTQAYDFTGNNNNAARIIGAMANDTLESLGQADTLIGLGGDDTYQVTAQADADDNAVIQEASGNGSDTLELSGNEDYTLADGASIETITLMGDYSSELVGNGFDQVIDGRANTLNGATLDGGAGTDTLIGGSGNDTFVVDSASDVIIDTTTTDSDSIVFNGSGGYDLAQGVQIDALSTTTDSGVYLVGNEFSQTITGGDGNDVLNGDGGFSGNADVLIGGEGDDVYRVWNNSANGATADTVTENAGEGFDTVYTSVNYALTAGSEIEQLSAADQTGTSSLRLFGNEFNNRVIGNAGNNLLAGGDGNDVLIGLGGADTFSFSATGVGNADTIQDFSSAQGDKIQLVNTDDTDGTFDLGNSIGAGEFTVGTAAVGNNAQIVYDKDTGRLFYDDDGAGGNDAVLFAQVTPGTELTAGDFTVVSAAPTV